MARTLCTGVRVFFFAILKIVLDMYYIWRVVLHYKLQPQTTTPETEMDTRKCIKKQRDRQGKIFAMVTDGCTYEVWALCENYDGKSANGVRKTWRYVSKGMNKLDAEQLYNRRIA